MSSLSEALGAEPPAAVAALSEEDRTRLVALIAAAREQQAADLQAAFAATLKHVPFPVRGIARKMLLG
jgi:hypothetical protein